MSRESQPGRGDPDESLTGFIYSENIRILERRGNEIQNLNDKSANLMQLLGVIFSLYSAAVIVAARLSTGGGASMQIDLIVNEYTGISVLLLAGAFLYTILAYHRTNIARGPSADFLNNDLADSDSIESAKREINEKVPGWVQNNEDEIRKDHTRLFNSKMCIFFSLSYLVIGAIVATSFSGTTVATRAVLLVVVAFISYVIYDRVRYFASSDASDGNSSPT